MAEMPNEAWLRYHDGRKILIQVVHPESGDALYVRKDIDRARRQELADALEQARYGYEPPQAEIDDVLAYLRAAE